MSKHTKEPWHVYDGCFVKAKHTEVMNTNGFLMKNGDLDLGDCGDFRDSRVLNEEICEANAQRIVACVNFCAGFTNEQLKEMWSLKEQLDSWGKESYKFSCVLERVTGGGMSYTHYDLETMHEHIHRFLCEERDEAFREGEEIGKLNAEAKQ